MDISSSSRKIRVVFAINDFIIGGAQRLYLDLFRHLDQTKFELHLLTLFTLPNNADFYSEVPEGVIVHRASFSGFLDIFSWLRLARLFKSLQPDVCVSSLFFTNTVTRVLAFFVGYRSIAIEHNTYEDKTGLQRFIDRILSRSTYTIVAVSNTVRAFTSKQEEISKEKFTVIPNGLDLARIDDFFAKKEEKSFLRTRCHIPDAPHIVLSVARLTTQKNHAALIDAFIRFHTSRPDFILVLVGGGGLKKSLETKVKDADADPYIIFAGETKDVLSYYGLADFFVSSSVIEGFGIAHAEALRAGLPVLSTKTAGPDELIREGENGLFIADSTSEAIEDGLTHMASIYSTFDREHIRHTVDTYDIRAVARAYEDLLVSSLA